MATTPLPENIARVEDLSNREILELFTLIVADIGVRAFYYQDALEDDPPQELVDEGLAFAARADDLLGSFSANTRVREGAGAVYNALKALKRHGLDEDGE